MAMTDIEVVEEMGYFIGIDYDKCCGCKLCELSCSMLRSGKGISSPALSRIRVLRREPQGLDIPMVCLHCEDPPCMVCPADAMSQDQRGVVMIHDDKCIGCKQCLVACPFGAISFNPEKGKVFKCDLCNGNPLCVRICNVAHSTDKVLTYQKPEMFEKSIRTKAFEKIANSVMQSRVELASKVKG